MANILLIEPNTLLARSYMAALDHAGHKVTHALSAQAAIHAADRQLPDVVVLELQLPMHGGLEFLHEFRSYAEWQDVPVIINTALPPPIIAKVKSLLVRDLGVGDVLYKPHATLQALLASIRELAVV